MIIGIVSDHSLTYTHLFRVKFTAYFSFVTFSLNYHNFHTNFAINPSVTSSLCSVLGCGIAVFSHFLTLF